MHMHQVVRQTNEKLNMIAIDSPDPAVTAAYTVSKIVMKSSLLGKIKYGFKSQHIDLQVLSELLETDWLDDIHDGSATQRSFEATGAGTFRLEFAARKEDLHTKVYRIDGIRYWGNLAGAPALMEYTGERYLVHNISSDCVRAIAEPLQPFVSAQCDQQGYVDARLSAWTKIYTVDSLTNRPMNTTMKESFPYNYVYCIGLWITILSETLRCPPYVFRINATTSWIVTDYRYEPSLETFEIEDSMMETIQGSE